MRTEIMFELLNTTLCHLKLKNIAVKVNKENTRNGLKHQLLSD